MTNTPYANLNPNLILDAIESLGFHCSGSLFQLNSFENRVYQVGIHEGEPLIAKFYRPDRWSNEAIIEEHEFARELQEHDIPVLAPLMLNTGDTLYTYHDFRLALFHRQSGRPLEVDSLKQLEWMGRFIGRMHAVSACKPFQHRIRLDVQNYGHQPYQYLLENNFIPNELRHNFCNTVETILQLIEERFQSFGEISYIRLHGDCHAGNVLWNNIGPQIVDLDDCLMGPAIQDIWMLLSGTNSREIEEQLNFILAGYYDFFDFNYREKHLIEPLRTLRMIHFTAWLAKRWGDPAFPLNFPWFNTPHYWQQQLQHLREQCDLLLENEEYTPHH